ncbi:MAG: hypothetical protein AcusKO_10810 [Acuticoccus sp.]
MRGEPAEDRLALARELVRPWTRAWCRLHAAICRSRCDHFTTADTEIANRAATWRHVAPSSSAAIARSRKSIEYPRAITVPPVPGAAKLIRVNDPLRFRFVVTRSRCLIPLPID